MQSKTAEILLDLNRQFYQTFALQFAQTRPRLQPGVQRILPDLLQAGSILDLGCGSGELARQLAAHQYRGLYLGMDSSTQMLDEARSKLPNDLNARFFQANLADSGWEANLAEGYFERILAFAVLHHLPEATLRLKILQRIRKHLTETGRFILSNWQFLNSPRLRSRLQPWERVGLHSEDVDEGDYLLDWRHGGMGLRYVHHFQSDELANLAASSSFSVEETFWSDGENGRLGLYQVWKPV